MEVINEIRDEDVDLGLLKEVPLSFSKGNLMMPLRQQDGEIVAAVSDIRGVLALKDIAKAFNLKPRPIQTASGVILDAIGRLYGRASTAEDVIGDLSGEDLSMVATEFEAPKDLLELTEEAPIIRLLNALFHQAVKERASDIHVEPYEKELEVRLRVDGILRKVLSPPKIIQEALISRVKIMANLDIAEKRLPQDGRIRLLVGGRDIDIRVSIIPTSFGERAVLRLLDRKRGLLSLSDVGLSKDNVKKMEDILIRTNGIVLVTGPTGSGKTTTLYAAINQVKTEEKNIITVEDPVEYQLEGVGQIQVNPRIGLNFASGLRSIVRQDPDIIMVGEIRDSETAEIAIQASLTGHLVLSTLHTNDAPTALTRLLDMGIEPFLVASSLYGVFAQRLVRVICPNCKKGFSPSNAELEYFEGLGRPGQLFHGIGCDKCKGKGYIGRTGIFELLIIDNEVRSMIMQRDDAKAIKEYAVSKGMKTLRMDGLDKVMQGITTLEEVLRVTQKDYADLPV